MNRSAFVDVALSDDHRSLQLCIRGSGSSELNLPIVAEDARYVASRLISAAAIVDPEGHRKVLADMAAPFGVHIALGRMRATDR